MLVDHRCPTMTVNMTANRLGFACSCTVASVDCQNFRAGVAGAQAGPVTGTSSPMDPISPLTEHSHAVLLNSTVKSKPPAPESVFYQTSPSSLMTFGASVTCADFDPPPRHSCPVYARCRNRTSILGDLLVHAPVPRRRRCCTSEHSSDFGSRSVLHSTSSQVPPTGPCPTSGRQL